jgi:hypothetical protein
MSSKVILCLSSNMDMFWHDVEYSGENFNTQFRWGQNVMSWQGKMAQFTYTQAITPNLMLGAEGGLNNNLLTPTNAVMAKYDTPSETLVGSLKSHCQPCQPGEDGIRELNLHYLRKVVKDRVSLATSLTVIPAALQHSSCVLGAEFQLHQSSVSTSFSPTHNKLTTVVQTKLPNKINFTLSAEGVFGAQNEQGGVSDNFRFGYGLSVG